MTATPAAQTTHSAQQTPNPMHFYCTDDSAFTVPICGASKPTLEEGEDCPLCGLVFDEIDVGARPCPYCRDSHWKDAE